MEENITIQEIMTEPADRVIEMFKSRRADIDHETNMAQLDPSRHDINDESIRPKKTVKRGNDTVLQDVTRLAMPFQKLIVSRSAAFLIGEGINLMADPDSDLEKEMQDMVEGVWHDNKLDYQTRKLARKWMSEIEVAEHWYIHEKNGKQRLRMQIWSRSEGDLLYPYFDEYGDLQAFGRGYKIGDIEYMDIWTSDKAYYYHNIEGTWSIKEERPNVLGKIPVIYYVREKTEWQDVQSLIDRYEKLVSDFSDANDYFASPMVTVKGRVLGFAEKGEQGKVLQLEENAEVSYLTWNQAPEAVKLEEELLRNGIFFLTQTPDISFREMKGLGASISGVALQMMFMDARLKALEHQEEFGEGLQRRINLIKAAIAVIDRRMQGAQEMTIEPEFVFYMPKNEEELVRMLVTATGNRPVVSQETAVMNSPFTMNAQKEYERVKEDEAGFFGNVTL